MKKIGKGWQYTVYDLGNGRVQKRKYSKFFQFLHIYLDLLGTGNFFVFMEAWRERKRVEDDEKSSMQYLQNIANILDWGILGNPKFIETGIYEQDKVTPLDIIFEKVSIQEGKEIIDKYLKLMYRTWEYGFSDKIFNFTINNGLNERGEIIQLDFGELTSDKEKMRRLINEKRWLKRASCQNFPEGELKEYYRKIMDPETMLKKLDELWRTKLQKSHG